MGGRDKGAHFISRTSLSKAKKKNTNWTEPEEAFLRGLYANYSNLYLSQILSKSKSSIIAKAFHLRLKKSNRYRKKVSSQNNQTKRHLWNEEEIRFLKEHYTSRSYEEIGEIINRTASAVSQKARQLRLKKYRIQ